MTSARTNTQVVSQFRGHLLKRSLLHMREVVFVATETVKAETKWDGLVYRGFPWSLSPACCILFAVVQQQSCSLTRQVLMPLGFFELSLCSWDAFGLQMRPLKDAVSELRHRLTSCGKKLDSVRLGWQMTEAECCLVAIGAPVNLWSCTAWVKLISDQLNYLQHRGNRKREKNVF